MVVDRRKVGPAGQQPVDDRGGAGPSTALTTPSSIAIDAGTGASRFSGTHLP